MCIKNQTTFLSGEKYVKWDTFGVCLCFLTCIYIISFDKKVEINVAAATELATVGIDEKTLSEVEELLKPVKNQTWPSGIQQGWLVMADPCLFPYYVKTDMFYIFVCLYYWKINNWKLQSTTDFSPLCTFSLFK